MKFVLFAALIAASLVFFYLPARADEDGIVDVFVTPKLISITVDPGSVDYGTVSINDNDARPNPEGFTVTNVGTVDVDLYIRGADTHNSDASPGGWTLGTAPGMDTYVHRFSTNPNPDLANFNPLTSSLQVFLSGVSPQTATPGSGEVDIKLSLATPTDTVYLGPQETKVTVLATDVGVAP